jgi:hypothetical protein
MDTNINSNVKLSNVIGAPFSSYVLLQLYQRAAQNSTVNRSNEDVLFLANKTGWARLVSSVNIELQPTSDILKLKDTDYQTYYSRFNLDSALPYNAPDSLAKNWILEAGCSVQNGNGINLRAGIGPDGAYGLGGTEELGYRPLPGLTGVTIETTGRLGSLRQANIQFKVWNMNQLNVVEALYFRLGYSMLLEWGHTQYFENDGNFQRNAFGIDDPFIGGKRKEQIQQDIARRSRNTFGNYDGMLGIVSNFSWSMNQDGGFDCTVKLIGLGSVMDSMRINQAYKLPDGLLRQYKKNKDALRAFQDQLDALREQVKAAKEPVVDLNQVIDPIPKTPTELRDRIVKYEKDTNTTFAQFASAYGISYYDQTSNFIAAASSDGTVTQGKHNYYHVFNSSNISANVAAKVKADYSGFYFNQKNIGFVRIPEGGSVSAKVNTGLLNSAIDALTYRVAGEEQPITNIVGGASSLVSQVFDYVTRGKSGPQYVATYQFENLVNAQGSTGASTYFSIVAKTSQDAADKDFQPTRQDILNALETWVIKDGAVTDLRVISTSKGVATLTGTFKSQPVKVSYSGPESNRAIAIQGNNGSDTRDVVITFTFTTTNSGFIESVGPVTPTQEDLKAQATQTANAGDTNGTINQANAPQDEAPEGFASALQAMLTVVQAETQIKIAKSINQGITVSTLELTKKFFQDGIMNGVLDNSNIPTSTLNLEEKDFLLAYASRGFNSSLMIDPTLYNTIPKVDFTKLCNAFAFAYGQGGEDGSSSQLYSPTYISFGYLLAFLNNMCLIYDSPDKGLPTNNNAITGTPKRPYVYIDFNPETNFCLTSPQQLSVDPLTCLIPLQATKAQYQSIFPENIVKNWRGINVVTPIFDPGGKFNGVSTVITKAGFPFKTPANAYQGRVMDILLNIDYLLGLVQNFAGADPEHAVKLEPFLQEILKDINKALGNTNAFRAAYRDDSNTIQIQDDQWVPSLNGTEASMLNAQEYKSKLGQGNDRKIAGLLPISSDPQELPVTGNLGLARQFQLKSVMSTKLASMIAISAQANTGSVNATDHSQLSYLNQNFQDRYKPYIQDASNGESGNNANSKNSSGNAESNDQKAAELFNDHIINVYSNFRLNTDRISLAKNYYIERMSKVKSGDPIVSATPFIPAELEMTLDGISGIIMGNAFTVPQDRLPLSLRGKDGLAKIAFIVTNLTHTIQNNEWLTKIKGQMIKLRENTKQVTAATLVGEIQNQIIQPLTSGDTPALSAAFNAANPWSAAFISYVMKEAGVSNFPFDASHADYAQALRLNNNGFQVLDPANTALKLGDLVVANRKGNKLTFKSKEWSGNSHGDIISSISGDTAIGIGGNVGQSVSTTSIGLVNGKLGRSDYFVILRPPQGNVNSIVTTVVTEYNLWRTNRWRETSPAALSTLRKYYQIVGIKI